VLACDPSRGSGFAFLPRFDGDTSRSSEVVRSSTNPTQAVTEVGVGLAYGGAAATSNPTVPRQEVSMSNQGLSQPVGPSSFANYVGFNLPIVLGPSAYV
jgi:hypothetical protein